MGSGWINGVGVLGDDIKNGSPGFGRVCVLFCLCEKSGVLFSGLPGTEGEEMVAVRGSLGIQKLE